MTITCEHVDSVLSAWFEGDLELAERQAVDAHLRECLRCASLVRDIEAIRRDAGNLPEMAPSRDLWEGIAARIEAPVVDLKSRAPRTPVRLRWRMAAAALVLMAASSGLTYVLMSVERGPQSAGQLASTSADDGATPSAPVASNPGVVTPRRPSSGSGSTVLIRAEPMAPEVMYDQEITRLRAILDERRGNLDTATVAAVEKSLKAIDLAIADARAALLSDAQSRFLNEQLNRALEKKLGVLRRVALLPVGAS
jgi:hypothetical protein